MEKQKNQIQTQYTDLILTLSTFLVRMSKEIQKKVVSFQLDLYLRAIIDNNLELDVRKMACSAIKLKINLLSKADIKITQVQQLLAKLEAIFTLKLQEKNSQQNLQKIQTTLEVVFEKVFQKFYDDSQKIQLFQKTMESLCQKPIENHQKTLRILQLLVRSMYYMSLNNQVLIGQLNLYLSQLVNSRSVYAKSQAIWIQIMLQTIKFMKELSDIVQINDQQQDNLIMQYMRMNTQLKQVFFKILCLNDNSSSTAEMIQTEQNHIKDKQASMICKNSRLNKIKAQLLQLWAQIWMYSAQPNLLELILNTILKVKKNQIVDDIQGILINCVVMLERSVTEKQYNQIFYKMTQTLVLKLFEIISISETQFKLINDDSAYFIQIMDDFCRKQELQLLKTRTGSLLTMFALAVDGYLTFITHLALLSVRQLQNNQKNQTQIGLLNTFKQNFYGSQESLIQVSILVLSCISDQIDKRNDLKISIYMHLQNMVPVILQSNFNKVIILRYMQMYAFYSFPGCLDFFISKYSNEQIYQEQLLKSYQTLVSYYDKKNRQMVQYIQHLTDRILLLSNNLTPLLEQAIMNNKDVIKSFKQKTMQKLVGWLVSFYKNQEILKITKISTLIIKVLHNNLPSVLSEQSSLYQPFDITFLNTELSTLQKMLIDLKFHPAEQCIVDICISHIEYLWNDQTNIKMTYELAKDFFQLGVLIVQRNNIVLNRCLLLFNTILSPNLYNKKQKKAIKNQIIHHFSNIMLAKVAQWLSAGQNYQQRSEDLWQMIQLAEIALYQCDPLNCQQNIDKISYQVLIKFQNANDSIVKSKCMIILLLIISLRPQDFQKYQFLNSIKLPKHTQVMVYQCRGYCYYLMKLIENYKNVFPKQYRVHLIQIIVESIYYLDSEKILLFNYEQTLFINGDPTAINAFRKYIQLNLPIKQADLNLYESFRTIIAKYQDKAQLVEMDSPHKFAGKISDIAGKISVGDRTRKKLIINRKVFN